MPGSIFNTIRIGTPIGAYGGNGRVWSYDPRVNSPLLCQLSYISKYNRLLRTCGLSARHLFILGLYLVNGCERLGSNQRSPPYEGGEITTSPLRNMVERIQLTYSTSRLFYQLNHIKLCCCYQQYLSRRNYSHIGFWQILTFWLASLSNFPLEHSSMVLLKGLEPLRLTAREPKSRTSAYSATAT